MRYLLSKLVSTFFMLLGVATLVFLLTELAPGTVADKFLSPELSPEQRDLLIAKYGLDKPASTRFILMLKNLATGNLGTSLVYEQPVIDKILEALPRTLILSSLSLLLTYPIGVALGVFQATRQGKLSDSATSLTSLLFYSMPVFWLALLLQLGAPSIGLPISGEKNPVMYESMAPAAALLDRAKHLVLPLLAMGVASAAAIARYMRSSMLEVIRQDYIRTARAKGLSEKMVIYKHALRNALLPIVTLIGLSLPRLVGGSVLVETVFAWPGMGKLIFDAIGMRDTPLIVGCFLLFAVMVAIGNIVADIAYRFVDPRIRLD